MTVRDRMTESSSDSYKDKSWSPATSSTEKTACLQCFWAVKFMNHKCKFVQNITIISLFIPVFIYASSQ